MFPSPEWPSLPVSESIRLRATRAMPPLAPETERVVARHWAEANEGGQLFNGRVFSADAVTPEEITGHWSEFRRVLAQIRDPTLSAALRVRSVAVCGALVGPDGIAIGRREAGASYQAGVWQLAPAGSVDQGAATAEGADWRAALMAELREELGIVAADVTSLRPLCLAQHPTGILDLGVRIGTHLSGDEIMRRHRDLGNGEYDRVHVAPAERIAATVAAEGGRLMPTVAAFLQVLLARSVS